MFNKLFRQLFHSHKQRLCTLWYRQGLLDGRNEMLKQQQSLPGLPDVPTIDLAQFPIETESVPVVPGDKLHEWGQAHKPDYKPVRLIKAPAVQHTDFPWLDDESWINSRRSALHELLGCYAETEVKLKAVKVDRERKS